ncbi:YciI family protein [Lysobacter sp. F6437]|uniref:YciI family protein n=1 Tax=Lysobacter sp. F6437 TaxID=3459296 RepID=UPI00403D80F5
MKLHTAISLCAVLALSPVSHARADQTAEQAPPAAYDAALAEHTGADDYGMRSYVLVVLKTGPTPVTDAEARKAMFAGHFANMERLSESGKLVVAGPFSKDPDGWRGLFVFAVDSVEEARALTATDPVIVSGEMVAEYHPWYSSAALMLIPGQHEKLARKNP